MTVVLRTSKYAVVLLACTQATMPTVLIALLAASVLVGLWFVALKRQALEDGSIYDSIE